MKVYLGPYRSWFGPYQMCNLLQHVGVSDDTCNKLAKKLPEKPFQWFQDKFKKRKIKVKIDYYDVWSMDHTLGLIVLPMLKLLKEKKHGAPNVDDTDVPEELRSTSAPPKEDVNDVDENHFKRWDWVMDQMIFSFEKTLDDDWEHELMGKTIEGEDGLPIFLNTDWEQLKAVHEKIQNGFRLFGVYFQALWD